MLKHRPYRAEVALVGGTMLVGLLGFWGIYVGARAAAQPHHHLHVVTSYLWMGLLLAQLLLLARGDFRQHRRLGMAVLVAGPLMVGSAALLTVHSAHRAIVAAEPDALMVANVVGTLWLALVVVLAFVLRKRRKVHGALLCSTMILFLGPALFFALIGFVPAFRIEGPETFHRFQTAGMTGQAILLLIVAVMFFRVMRNHWPYLLAASAMLVAELGKALLAGMDWTDAVTRLVASTDPLWTFALASLLVAGVLAVLLMPAQARGRVPAPG